MNSLVTATLVVGLAPPLLAVLFTGRVCHRRADRIVRGSRYWFGGLAAVTVILAIGLATGRIEAFHQPLLGGGGWPVLASLHYDGVSALMLAMVASVGWMVLGYSDRYLAGDPNRGRFFASVATTVGAISVMVVSGNLLMLAVAWWWANVGLHRLLMHNADRPGAVAAAWARFTTARIGDVGLLVAVVTLAISLGSFELTDVFTAIAAGTLSDAVLTPVAGGLVFAAAVMSVQFPSHTWLPGTMETPTPVSALMHAGIVNAGGFLLIRFAPLMVEVPAAMAVTAIIGGGTACFGAMWMLTQPSVKGGLAASTVAQMGFMMLQCGLGAFSAAMLHILAHSLYKAHAFLGSGSVLESASNRASDARQVGYSWRGLVVAATGVVTIYALAWTLIGAPADGKPGGLLLGGILCLALTEWLRRVIDAHCKSSLSRSVLIIAGLCLVYVISYHGVDAMVSPTLPVGVGLMVGWGVIAAIGLGFIGLFVFQSILIRPGHPAWMDRLYVHIANGLYVDDFFRRRGSRTASR